MNGAGLAVPVQPRCVMRSSAAAGRLKNRDLHMVIVP
jgi:hypothetical protein